MAPARAVRKLAAILSADAVGYTRLIEQDEAGTRARLNGLLSDLFAPVIGEHGGRIVKTMGDGVLADFASVTEAVECAFRLQTGLAERNAQAPEDRRMEFRMGINLGDVIVEGDDIHGDGVNVAARLEGLAEPGGICISETVYDQVRRRLPYNFAAMGPQKVKNVAEPVSAYAVTALPASATTMPRRRAGRMARLLAAAALALLVAGGTLAWLNPWSTEIARASIDRMAFPLPDKPSIAVIPFRNLSVDPEQAYFADGLTEDFITRLAAFPNLFVIGRDSTRQFGQEKVEIRNVSEGLGVRYVLDGSVRRDGKALRVSARLVDALGGAVLWGETYDRTLDDVFAVQNEVTREVVSRLASNVVTAEFERQSRIGTRSFEAYDLFLRGYRETQVVTAESNARAIRLFERALQLDPAYGRSMAALGIARASNVRFRWASGPENTFESALELTRRAVAAAPEDEFPYRARGGVLRLSTDLDGAVEAYEKALARSPSNPDTLMALGFTLAIMGRGDEAVKLADTAMRLNPYPPLWYHSWRGIALFTRGELEPALESFGRFQAGNPDLHVGYMWVAACHALLGDTEKANQAKAELLARAPWFTIQGYLAQNKPRGIHRERLVRGLRLAGIPEEPQG